MRLQHRLPHVAVIRKAIAGTTPLKALLAWDIYGLRAGDTVVMYLSEFDFIQAERLSADWMRPFATWNSLYQLCTILTWDERRAEWRQLTDLAMSATFGLWRYRDYLDIVLFNFFGPGEKVVPTAPSESSNENELVLTTKELRAFSRLVSLLRDRNVGVVVFEGQLNPLMYGKARLEISKEIMHMMGAYAQTGQITYIPKSLQAHLFDQESQWSDMTHLNENSKELFTDYLATYFGSDGQ